jgi:mannose-6-phosphate isomerase
MVIKLQPLFFEKVWGGNKIKDIYKYECSNKTGEAWGISAHKNGSSVIVNTKYKGLSLRDLYLENRELFGNYPKSEFPILIKVIDAMDDLSIQVHPDDEYARKYEDSYGKTECWYILDAEPNTMIVVGNKAKSFEEFKSYVDNYDFEPILNKFSIKKGDQFNIYAGTIHAICKGTLVLEIQQSSDVTYRLYDYNRLSDGKLRELHLKQALDVVKIPDSELAKDKPTQYFDFDILKTKGQSEYKADQYGDYIFILEGKAIINDVEVNKGDFIFITSKSDYLIDGEIEYFRSIIK